MNGFYCYIYALLDAYYRKRLLVNAWFHELFIVYPPIATYFN